MLYRKVLPFHRLSSNEGLLKWFDLRELPFFEMPLTSQIILQHYVTHLDDINLYGGIVTNETTDLIRLD